MHLVDTIKNIELAEVELQYLLADVIYSRKRKSPDEDIRNVIISYKTALESLQFAVLILEKSRDYNGQSEMKSMIA